MGRYQQPHKGKPCGRNELISDLLLELTGQLRGRKQVSSNIQVLKPFTEGDPYINAFFKDDGKTPRGHRGNGRRSSHYPVSAPPKLARTAISNAPRREQIELQRVKYDLAVFQPVDFQMFVQQCIGLEDQKEVHRLHTYTNSTVNPLDENHHYIEDLDTLRLQFPLLACMHAKQPLDCNIMDAEASLAFPLATWKSEDGSPLPNIELGIYFLCMSRHLPVTPDKASHRPPHMRVMVQNTFYENGALCFKDAQGAASEAIFEPSKQSGAVETRIKFGSTFWAKTLGRLAGRLLDTSKDHSEEVASYLKSINAVQEVIAWTEHGPERLLTIHWKFRHSTSTRGRTSWRRLVLPTTNPAMTDDGNKIGRANSMHEFIPDTVPEDMDLEEHQEQPESYSQPAPTLQSPFEYESSSGSALSSATWASSFGDESVMDQTDTTQPDFANDNAFDFNLGNINLSYEPAMGFENFDSSAFSFDASTANLTGFETEGGMQDYSQQMYFPDGYADPFATQQAVSGVGESFATQAGMGGYGHMYDGYSGQYDQQAFALPQDQLHEQHQAFGGAVVGKHEMGVVIKEEDALIALADASDLASALHASENAR